MKTYSKQEPETIQAMFGSIAPVYDRGNALLSMQLHRLWNRQLVKGVLEKKAPHTFLDLCAGTGAITFDYLQRRHAPANAILLDFCQEMLDEAANMAKAEHFRHHKISYLKADAQSIPLNDRSVDAVTVAYGIRNIKEPARCFEEVLRVLRPGGVFGILELTRPKNPFLRAGHSAYLHSILPLMGRLFLRNEQAYRYLCNSIEHFTQPDVILRELVHLGFSTCMQQPLMGGVATLILASKADTP